jgi:hypothetical protein
MLNPSRKKKKKKREEEVIVDVMPNSLLREVNSFKSRSHALVTVKH